MTALRGVRPLVRRRQRGRSGGAADWPLGAEVAVDGVVKSYGQIEALRGISLIVQAGEWVTITGPSGSGKSTLLNLIGALDRPDAGTIRVAGRLVPEPRQAVEFRRHMVGFVFQDNPLLPYLSAQANIEAALLAAGVGRRERHERALELLGEVGLASRAQHRAPGRGGARRARPSPALRAFRR